MGSHRQQRRPPARRGSFRARWPADSPPSSPCSPRSSSAAAPTAPRRDSRRRRSSARVAFIEDHGDYNDRDLARLCPGLYPRDFLTNDDDWPAGEARSGDLSARAIDAARTREAAADRGRRLRRLPAVAVGPACPRWTRRRSTASPSCSSASPRTSSRASSSPSAPRSARSRSRARSPRAPTATARRYVDVAYADPYVRRARIEHGSDAALETVPSWIGAADPRARRAALRAHRAHRPGRAAAARGPRPRARRRRPSADAARGRQGPQRPHDELDDRPVPDAGLGGARAPRPRARRGAREAVGADRPRLPARRARPGRRLARADGDAQRRRRAPHRARASTRSTSRGRAPT